jgi:hypothetical protein
VPVASEVSSRGSHARVCEQVGGGNQQLVAVQSSLCVWWSSAGATLRDGCAGHALWARTSERVEAASRGEAAGAEGDAQVCRWVWVCQHGQSARPRA